MAVDPSLSSTGYAILDKIDGDAIRVGRIITHKNISNPERIRTIYSEITAMIIENSQINTLVIEDQFMYKNADTLKKLSQLRGVIILSATLLGVPCFTYTPTQIKKAVTGNGNADKNEVYQGIRSFYKHNQMVFNHLYSPNVMASGKNKNDDISDALAIGRTHRILQEPPGDL